MPFEIRLWLGHICDEESSSPLLTFVQEKDQTEETKTMNIKTSRELQIQPKHASAIRATNPTQILSYRIGRRDRGRR